MRKPRIKDLTGKKFGHLTVIRLSHIHKRAFWVCKCDCGNEKIASGTYLGNGDTKSCGCSKHNFYKDHYKTKHNKCGTGVYRIYNNMKTRCYNSNHQFFHCYGGKGVKVCDRWLGENGFINFYADMGDRPSIRHSIDRIDSNGDYEPKNCKWSTQKQQSRNTCRNVWFIFEGINLVASEWAEILKIKSTFLTDYYRTRNKNPVEYYVNKRNLFHLIENYKNSIKDS